MEQIRIFDNADDFVWVPVAKPTSQFGARAFLPFNGINAYYRHGYKARPETSLYFDAVRSIQKAFIDNETKVFNVKNGTKQERQRKDRWRHRDGSALLGPTLGWVCVSLERIEKLNAQELADCLDTNGGTIARLTESASSESIYSDSSDHYLHDKSAKEPPSGLEKPERKVITSSSYGRSSSIVDYVLSVANGICECCRNPAPFIRAAGDPYLEVHHVKPLSEAGSDTSTNTVALCPNCHRELHHGENKLVLIEQLYKNNKRLIRE